MSTQSVADKLVSLCKEGKFHDAIDTLYADDVVSIESFAPPGQSAESRGLAAVQKKAEQWSADTEVHSSTIEGPLVAGAHFAVSFKLDVTSKSRGQRMTMEEIGVYEVKNDKVVHEKFYYRMG